MPVQTSLSPPQVTSTAMGSSGTRGSGAVLLNAPEAGMPPASTVDRIARRFGIARHPGEFTDFVRSTKDHGKDGAYYRDYYGNERWKADLSDAAIEIINTTLDHALAAEFGYQRLDAAGIP